MNINKTIIEFFHICFDFLNFLFFGMDSKVIERID